MPIDHTGPDKTVTTLCGYIPKRIELCGANALSGVSSPQPTEAHNAAIPKSVIVGGDSWQLLRLGCDNVVNVAVATGPRRRWPQPQVPFR